ncbi:MAG TPA: ATP-binding protein, partial [Candidatus Polarisedimenticolia bacterium]|nr:ATP-binding protein [Candidatus Polarisedimenticolia bacterium]
MLLLGYLAGLPGVLLALVLLWSGNFSPRLQVALSILLLLLWSFLAYRLRDRVVRPIQTLSNMMSALLEGDYSIRTRASGNQDALGLAFQEVNALGQTLREQRLGALDATALLRKVMEEIDTAVFAFDHENRLRLVNRAGERLLGQPAERLLGDDVGALGLDLYSADGPRTIEARFPGGAGRWEVRSTDFRQGGLPHRLLMLTDLSRALRAEEREAWQRLVRVLGHEINNSLTPIISIAGSLRDRMAREPADVGEDLDRALGVIEGRASALRRFMSAHARLAKLPRPQLAPIEVGPWVRRVVALETRLGVEVVPGPDTVVEADSDQLDQVLINLLRNAVEAASETGGGVRVGWDRDGSAIEVRVEDDGPGVSESENLFVPFF